MAILVVLFAGPIFELADQWDNIPVTGNDTMLSVVMLLTFAGALFAVRRFTIKAISVLYRLSRHATATLQGALSVSSEVASFELDSGPIPSLTSLRI